MLNLRGLLISARRSPLHVSRSAQGEKRGKKPISCRLLSTAPFSPSIAAHSSNHTLANLSRQRRPSSISIDVGKAPFRAEALANPFGQDIWDQDKQVGQNKLNFEDEEISTSEEQQPIFNSNAKHIQNLHLIAMKLPRVHNRVIQGQQRSFRPQKLSSAELSEWGRLVKLLDEIVTSNVALSTKDSLELLRLVQAFPDQLCQWASLHLVEPRSRAAQLWALGVLHALARLQHPLTLDLWLVAKDSPAHIPIFLYLELCHYFSLGTELTEQAHSAYKHITSSERAAELQNVLRRAKQSGNPVIIVTCWNQVIQALLIQDDIASADKELQALQRMGITPPIEILQAFIKYYSSHVKSNPAYAEKVAAFHSRMKQLNMLPDLQTYSNIIKCYERTTRYKQMDAVLLEMTHSKLSQLSKNHQTNNISPSSGQDKAQKSPQDALNENPNEDWLSTHLDDNSILDNASLQVRTTPRRQSARNMSESTTEEEDVPFTEVLKTKNFDDPEEGKRRAKASAQESSSQNIEIRVGKNLVIDGSSQWLGGGRKHGASSKLITSVQRALNAMNPHATSTHIAIEDKSPGKTSEAAALAAQRDKIVEAWSRAIYRALSLGSIRKAMVLVEEMQSLGLTMNDRICLEFMFFAGKRKLPRLLTTWWETLNHLPGFTLRRKHYLIYMRELLRLDKAVEARKIMTLLTTSFGGHSDDVYALWLRYYAGRGLSTSVEHTLRQMEANQVEYGFYSTSALMEIYSAKGDLKNLFSWLEHLKSRTSNLHALDDVMAKCVYQLMTHSHPLVDPKSWIDLLPFNRQSFPRFLSALLIILGHQHNTSGLDYVMTQCRDMKNPHVLVGLIRGNSLLPPSPKRDHTIGEIVRESGPVKLSLNVSQNNDILNAFADLEMPTLITAWLEEQILQPSHVVEPSRLAFQLLANACLTLGNPELFVSLATKAFDKYGSRPSFSTIAHTLRTICTLRDPPRIAALASPLLSLYSHDPTRLLMVFDDELKLAGVARPSTLPSPTALANPQILDIPAYVSKRLGLTS